MKTKSIITSILISLFLILPCFADKFDDKGETTVFSKVIEFTGESADSLFDKSQIWFEKNFKMRDGDPNNSSIDYSSKDNHTIQGTYVDTVRYYWPDFTSAVSGLKYDFKINMKDGKIRVTMQLIEYRLVNGQGNMTWIKGGPKNEKKGKSADLFNTLTESIKHEFQNNVDEDW